MAFRLVVDRAGTPADLKAQPFDPEPPGPGQVQIRQGDVGVNMIDTYVISGAYAIDPFPLTPGVEGAGVVTAIGDGVTGFKVGDRVAYGGPPLGAYASARTLPPDYMVRMPDGLDFAQAAAITIAGATAQMMVRRVYPVGLGTRVLVHAAAGGTGRAIVRWAAHLGAQVFGTVGGPAKADVARADGCRHVIDYRRTDFADAVLALTDGAGVDVVYDGVGHDTFVGSFKALTPTGMFVSFGQASGPCPPIDLGNLPVTFSNTIARPSVFAFNPSADVFRATMREVFEAVASGVLDPEPTHRYALEDADQALDDLTARRTSGAIVLTV